jgi:nicotinamide riboside kinase
MSKKISFIGPAGCGKSTLSSDVYVQIKKKGFNAELVNEAVRFDIHQNGPATSIWEQYRIWNNQRVIEDAVPIKVDFVITDSGCLTPYFYACLYTKTANERERLVLADMFKFFIDDLYKKRYDHIFFLPGKLTKEQTGVDTLINDGTRFQSAEELDILDHYMTLVFTKMFHVDNIHILNVPLDERTDAVLDIVLNSKS